MAVKQTADSGTRPLLDSLLWLLASGLLRAGASSELRGGAKTGDGAGKLSFGCEMACSYQPTPPHIGRLLQRRSPLFLTIGHLLGLFCDGHWIETAPCSGTPIPIPTHPPRAPSTMWPSNAIVLYISLYTILSWMRRSCRRNPWPILTKTIHLPWSTRNCSSPAHRPHAEHRDPRTMTIHTWQIAMPNAVTVQASAPMAKTAISTPSTIENASEVR